MVNKLIGEGSCILEAVIEGECVLASNSLDSIKKYSGKIIIIDDPNPSLVLAMRNAKAVISKNGGLTCHLSILGRELGVPVIVGVGEDAFNKIKTFNKLTIICSNNKGMVYANERIQRY